MICYLLPATKCIKTLLVKGFPAQTAENQSFSSHSTQSGALSMASSSSDLLEEATFESTIQARSPTEH
jgi:hypothetical protein